VPIRDPGQLRLDLSSPFRASAGGGFRDDGEARQYIQRFYPGLFQQQQQVQPDPLNEWMPRRGFETPDSQQWARPNPYAPPRGPPPVQDVKASCEREYCYKSCRLALLGGGRCTPAGCLCYHSYFDADGRPLVYRFPEDYTWHALKDVEKRRIVNAMRQGRPKRPVPTLPPPPPKGMKEAELVGENLYRPTSRPTARPPYIVESEKPPYFTTARPPYAVEDDDSNWINVKTTARPPLFSGGEEEEEERRDGGGGGGWWGETQEAEEPASFGRSSDNPPTSPPEEEDNGGDWWPGEVQEEGGSGFDDEEEGDDFMDSEDEDGSWDFR